MKERVNRIFDLWNRRNIDYYKEAFKKLEKEEPTFNFVAAFFPFQWLIFRKMYKYAISIAAGSMLLQLILCWFFESLTKKSFVPTLVFIIISVLLGFCGNALYFKIIKTRIARGYLEIKDYNSISPIWSVVPAFAASVIPYRALLFGEKPFTAMNVLPGFSMILFMLIAWAIDYKMDGSKESWVSTEFERECVDQYLGKANPKNMTILLFLLVLIYGLVFVIRMFQNGSPVISYVIFIKNLYTMPYL